MKTKNVNLKVKCLWRLLANYSLLPFLPMPFKSILRIIVKDILLLITPYQNLTPGAWTPSHHHHCLRGLLFWSLWKPLLPLWTFWMALCTLRQICSLQSTKESALGKLQDWKGGIVTNVLSGIQPEEPGVVTELSCLSMDFHQSTWGEILGVNGSFLVSLTHGSLVEYYAQLNKC